MPQATSSTAASGSSYFVPSSGLLSLSGEPGLTEHHWHECWHMFRFLTRSHVSLVLGPDAQSLHVYLDMIAHL